MERLLLYVLCLAACLINCAGSHSEDEGNVSEEFEKEKLLIYFEEENKNNKKNNKNETANGLWNIKFMKNAENNMNSKLKDVLNEIDCAEEFDYSEEDQGKKKKNKKLKKEDSEDEEENIKTDSHKNNKNKNLILNARIKNKINILPTKNTEQLPSNPQKKITNEVLDDLNEEAKTLLNACKYNNYYELINKL